MGTDNHDSPTEEFRCLRFAESPEVRSVNCIVWLHGIGERGSDLALVANFGLPAALKESRLSVNADVLCPQLEAGLSWSPDRLVGLLSQLKTEYRAVALVGFSLGAVGVCELIARRGPQTNVHVALAPRTATRVTAAQTGTRLLIFSGEHDPWPESTDFLNEIRLASGVAEMATLPGEGHFISESALVHPKFVEAMALLGITFIWSSNEA